MNDKNFESDDWKSLKENEKEEIINVFIDNNLLHLLDEYKSMSNEEMKKICCKNMILLTINNIYNFLLRNGRCNSSFTNYKNLKDIDYIRIIDEDVYIEESVLNFEVDEILLSCYKSVIQLATLFYHKKESLISLKQLNLIYDNLITYEEPKKDIISTYLMIDNSGYVKIGKAKCIETRLKTLRIGNPTIRIIAVLNKNIEKKLHKIYQNDKIIGEWFNLTQDNILDIINEFGFKETKL